MKRKGRLYPLIATHENLKTAFAKAAKGKRDRADVIVFCRDFDTNIHKLREQILSHSPDIGHYRFFQVHDPKLRQICAASFPERVLHHAVMNICEPALESYAIYDSYACRKGKGNRRALARAKQYAGKYDWYLKLDIRKYFDSIDHAILLKLLEKRFKDKELLFLFHQLFETYHTQPGKGFPIGNLISQHMANFYLGVFDHWIKEERRVEGYIRYMDDFAVFANGKDQLKTELAHIMLFLNQHLDLHLKGNIQINRCAGGIPFLGFRVFPNCIRLSPKSRHRFSKKFRQYENRFVRGDWNEKELICHMEPLMEFVKTAESCGFRRNVICRYGVLS